MFCNQQTITGYKKVETTAEQIDKIRAYLTSHHSQQPVQIAFYGGTFTALPRAIQDMYLKAARLFVRTGQVQSIRLSTRPDCITSDTLTFLKENHVTIIELGAQSMDNRVLALCGRGHTANDTHTAVTLLKEHGFTVGLQLMPGLPGDAENCFKNTIYEIIDLKPHFVRLYPALVIKGTKLEELYKRGQYVPLTLSEAINRCREAYLNFMRAGISVIRMGLQPTEELERPGTIVAGPFHPAFSQLVISSILLDSMRSALEKKKDKLETAIFYVNPRDISAAIGQRRVNIVTLKKEFGLQKIYFVANQKVCRNRVVLSASPTV